MALLSQRDEEWHVIYIGKMINIQSFLMWKIDIGGEFCENKFINIFKELKIESFMLKINYEKIKIYNLKEFMAFLYSFESIFLKIKEKNVQIIKFKIIKNYKILILPEIATLFWTCIDNYKKRSEMLNTMMILLHNFSLFYKVTVFELHFDMKLKIDIYNKQFCKSI